MKIDRVDHVGIAVKNLDAAIRFYETVLGMQCDGIEEVADQKVRAAFFRCGTVKIELLESTSAEGPLAKFIEKRGEGLHHIAYRVDDLRAALRDAESQGIRLIDREPRRGAGGMRIAFLHPKSAYGTLIELCEREE
jgi:methylmalonyl-CoA/ethylmalonyl-CoA epimerase